MANHPRSHSGVGVAIHENKAAQGFGMFVIIEHQRFVGGNIAHADVVKLQLLARLVRQGIDINPMLDGGNGGCGPLRGQLDLVAAPGVA